MKITFLGSGAANAFPEAFCKCSNCDRARQLGGPSLRKRSAALVNTDLLLDLGPDIMAAAQIHGCPLTTVRYCLQTASAKSRMRSRRTSIIGPAVGSGVRQGRTRPNMRRLPSVVHGFIPLLLRQPPPHLSLDQPDRVALRHDLATDLERPAIAPVERAPMRDAGGIEGGLEVVDAFPAREFDHLRAAARRPAYSARLALRKRLHPTIPLRTSAQSPKTIRTRLRRSEFSKAPGCERLFRERETVVELINSGSQVGG